MSCAYGFVLHKPFSEAEKIYSGACVVMFDSISNKKPLSLAKSNFSCAFIS